MGQKTYPESMTRSGWATQVIRGGSVGLLAALLAAVTAPAAATPPLTSPALTSMARTASTEPQGVRLRIENGQPPASAALDLGRFSFTTPGDNGASRTARANVVDRSFRFTPSGGADRKAPSVAVATRTAATGMEAASPQVRSAMAAAQAPANGASGYQVGMALEWKGLALSGLTSRDQPANGLGTTSEMGVGLSYGGRRWRTGVTASAEHGSPIPLSSAAAEPERYQLQATGAFLLSPAFSLSGGVRYRTNPANPSPLGANKEEEAVYVGGKLAF